MGWPDDIWNDQSLNCDQTEECAEKYIKGFLEPMIYLYKHEINFKISCFWDAGFQVGIGDDMNGYIWKECFPTLKEAIEALNKRILEERNES